MTCLKKPMVWMFSGQGSQYYQMGKDLYQQHQVFRSWMDRLDQVASQYTGQSIVELLYDNKQPKSKVFDQTLYSHPALFMVQYSLAKTLMAENFPAPDYLFGASLGEFVAAALADVADVESMLFDCIKQARLFDSHCKGGAMLVVLDSVEAFRTNPVFANHSELSGINFNRCFVVSGVSANILQIANQLKQQDITHQVLSVSVAFHSSQIDNVEDIFMNTFANTMYRPANMPIISCARFTDSFHKESTTVLTGNDRFSSGYWWNVVRQPIEFQQTLKAFEIEHSDSVYLDIGPSGTMATFAKYNLANNRHQQIMQIMTPYNNAGENMERARDQCIHINQGFAPL